MEAAAEAEVTAQETEREPDAWWELEPEEFDLEPEEELDFSERRARKDVRG